MIGAGAGIAPFRGFIQERYLHLQEQKDLDLARAVLYLGCRSSFGDRLYAEEMDKWSQFGAVNIKYAFSQQPDKSEGCKYVQDRLLMDAKLIEELWQKNAKLYVCGNSKFAQEAKVALKAVVKRALEERGEHADEQILKQRLEKMTEERFVTDVFG